VSSRGFIELIALGADESFPAPESLKNLFGDASQSKKRGTISISRAVLTEQAICKPNSRTQPRGRTFAAVQNKVVLFQELSGGERIADQGHAVGQTEGLVNIAHHNLHDRLTLPPGGIYVLKSNVISNLISKGGCP